VPGYRRACLPVSWHFWLKYVLSEAIKESVKKDARNGSALADLRPTRRVALSYQLAGITPSKDKGHAPFSKSWA
jgi:hypothetical protein